MIRHARDCQSDNIPMNRFGRPATAKIPALLLIPVCAVMFLLILAMGNPPSAEGSEPAWTEVLAWSFMHGAQWGRDIVYTYGPLGFLQPYTSYVDGMYAIYAVGQVLLPLAFVATIGLLFRRAALAQFALFSLAYLCSVLTLPGDIAWAFTLLFGTVCLLNLRMDLPAVGYYVAVVSIAAVCGVLAISKFTLVPLWAMCVAILAGTLIVEGRSRRAVLTAFLFVLAAVLAWIACGQQLGNLPRFLWTSSEIAAGYGHAMGMRAPFLAEAAGIFVLAALLAVCARGMWLARTEWRKIFMLALAAISAVLFWRAFFTRGDHCPWFFSAMALLPFVLLRDANLALDAGQRRHLVLIVLASSALGLYASLSVFRSPLGELPELMWGKVRDGVYNMGRLRELGNLRHDQWRELAQSSQLPRIRAAVGNGRIDVITWEQGIVLLNGLNYAPRPIFQSHAAFTPALARLNEAYFLGDRAPDFVMLKLDSMDHRLPMSEDGLTMIALLQHYRPRLMEKDFLLLQRDARAGIEAAGAAERRQTMRLGIEAPIGAVPPATVAAIHLDLNAFGKLYTLVFREPALKMTLRTSDGKDQTFRLIRQTADLGFVLSPVLQSASDWVHVYLSRPLPQVQNMRIDAETPLERLLFEAEFSMTLHAAGILQAEAGEAGADISGILYPGFNVLPQATADVSVIVEDGRNALFLHAPAALAFEPKPGNYRIFASYGIERTALTDPGCQSGPDGIGVSLLLHHDGLETPLWHAEIDPFHSEQDRGAQQMEVRYVDVGAGDRVEYRVDPGHGGKNISCDWSYVRDLVFKRMGDYGSGATDRDRPFADGFE